MKTGRRLLWVSLSVLVLLIVTPPADAVQDCGIGAAAQPPVVNFPSSSLPSNGELTFSEIFNVNYSSGFANRTLTIQYLNGSGWNGIRNFTGNRVGFTEVDVGLSSAWVVFGANRIRVVGGSCISNEATFTVRSDRWAVPLEVAVYAALALGFVLFILLGRKLGWKIFVIVAAATYLAIAPFTGQRYDIYFLLSSGIRILQHVNPFDPGNPAAYPGPLKWAYPPIYAAYSSASFLLFQFLTGASLPTVPALTYPGWLTSSYSVFQAYVPPTLPVLVFLLKLPMVASAILTGFLIKKMTGSKSAAAGWIANPLVLVVAAIWGQLDPIATLFALASIYSWERGKQYHAYMFASLGAAVKVWPLLLIPLMLVVSLRREGRRAVKPLVAVLPALMGTVGLYALYGNAVESFYVLVYARGIPTFAGAFSVNGLTWQQILFVLNVPPVPLFLLVGIPIYVAMLAWTYRKGDGDVVKWLVVSILVFYLTYNYVNPQYFYWILPLLIVQGRRLAGLVFTALPMIYIVLAYNVFYFVSPAILPNQFGLGASIVEQLKVSASYQSFFVLVLVAGLIPTLAYLSLLHAEVKHGDGTNPSGSKPGQRVGRSGVSGAE